MTSLSRAVLQMTQRTKCRQNVCWLRGAHTQVTLTADPRGALPGGSAMVCTVPHRCHHRAGLPSSAISGHGHSAGAAGLSCTDFSVCIVSSATVAESTTMPARACASRQYLQDK